MSKESILTSNQQTHACYLVDSPPNERIEGVDSLAELALDLSWSWNHATDQVWRQLDPDLWELTRNPWVVLQTVSRDKLKHVLTDLKFHKHIDDLLLAKREAVDSPAWFQQEYPESPLKCVAYFSMEFMLSDALPIYSGGLGNVAGDQLKAASDLGVPVVGVGLLYQQGYFRQVIDKDGAQQELFPFNDPGQLPITPLRDAKGEWLRLKISLPGYSVWLRTWQVQVGQVKLYLLDSNDVANFPAHRGITSELYGGGSELRIKQEILLGIGGWRLLDALGIQPEVCHLNEGHAAFAILERARSFMEETGQSFEVALAVTRAGNIFTTHTAVAAGFDCFSSSLIKQYLGNYAEKRLGISLEELMALGRKNPNDSGENFNMAYLAMRGSGSVNGVSRLHGEVSRQLFSPLYPRWPLTDMPIGHVTNGVHMPTWDSAESDALWTEACGKDRWHGTTEKLKHDIRQIDDARLWELRSVSRREVVSYAREHVARDMAISGAEPDEIERTKRRLNPVVLTLGFARRFATYKRPDLLLHDPERLLKILTNSQQPVQLILAGKAHPADEAGQALIREWTQFLRRDDPHPPVIFLADYDMLMAERLVQGVDVWINTPRRPWEASGTSGMKVLVNGGLNLSELDGWWAEAYAPDVGWAVGDGLEHGEDPAWDAAEAEALYQSLENEVIPEFYSRDSNGIPVKWIARVRESMARLTPQFSANRTVREYTEEHYLTAATTYLKRAANKGAAGQKIVDWQHSLEEKWVSLRIGEVKVETKDEQHIFEAQVYLDGLDSDAVRIELHADGEPPIQQEMIRVRELVGAVGGYAYHSIVSAGRPVADFTVRVIPHHEGVSVPLENLRILWQK
ncbi:MAG: starch phosphorylase [Cryomorphaceae bacterium]|jgi:starch phosphorylase